MGTLALVIFITLVMVRLWWLEEHSGDRMITEMAKQDWIAQKNRGDIVKGVRTRGY